MVTPRYLASFCKGMCVSFNLSRRSLLLLVHPYMTATILDSLTFLCYI